MRARPTSRRRMQPGLGEREPDGDDTLLRLTHTRLPAPAVPAHRDGWRH